MKQTKQPSLPNYINDKKQFHSKKTDLINSSFSADEHVEII